VANYYIETVKNINLYSAELSNYLKMKKDITRKKKFILTMSNQEIHGLIKNIFETMGVANKAWSMQALEGIVSPPYKVIPVMIKINSLPGAKLYDFMKSVTDKNAGFLIGDFRLTPQSNGWDIDMELRFCVRQKDAK